MNREIERLARAVEGLHEPSPAWDDPTGPRDIAFDEVVDRTLGLGPQGLHALGAAIDPRCLTSVYRLSVRAASRAVSTSDPARCQAALAAAVMAQWDEVEWRELLINVAPHQVAATRVTGSAHAIFEWAAGQAVSTMAPVLRAFGDRADVTLEAFGWKEMTDQNGTWFVLSWWKRPPERAPDP